MKKVLFVATVVRMHINVFHTPYLKWFQEHGWDTTVAARNDYENPDDCIIPYCNHYVEIPFERNPFKKNNLKAFSELKKLIDEEEFDLIYCHTPVGAMITRLAAVSARNKGSKVVYMAHGFHFFKGAPLSNWLIYYPVERVLARLTDMILTINNEDYCAAQKFHIKNVEIVPGVGIDLSRFTPSSEKKEELRNNFEIDNSQFVIMSVGELSDRKNQIVILQAMARLKNPDITYVICGDGSNRELLENTAKELGISKQLKLLGFRHDVNELYNVADAFVFPSLQEGLPVSVMEAMAMKLPVIASKIRGSEDLVDTRKGGFLIEKNSINKYAQAIDYMYKHRDKLGKIGSYNQKKVQQYSIDAVVSVIMEKILKIV